MTVKLCVALGKTPEEIRQMSKRDFMLFYRYMTEYDLLPDDMQKWQMMNITAMFMSANMKKADYKKAVKTALLPQIGQEKENGLSSEYLNSAIFGTVRERKKKG